MGKQVFEKYFEDIEKRIESTVEAMNLINTELKEIKKSIYDLRNPE